MAGGGDARQKIHQQEKVHQRLVQIAYNIKAGKDEAYLQDEINQLNNVCFSYIHLNSK